MCAIKKKDEVLWRKICQYAKIWLPKVSKLVIHENKMHTLVPASGAPAECELMANQIIKFLLCQWDD